MRIDCINATSTNFGTKVKINKKLKKVLAGHDNGAELNNYIRALENNGKDDRFVIAYAENPRNGRYLHADVVKLKGTKIYVGKSIELNVPKNGCPDLSKLYSMASQNMHPFI